MLPNLYGVDFKEGLKALLQTPLPKKGKKHERNDKQSWQADASQKREAREVHFNSSLTA